MTASEERAAERIRELTGAVRAPDRIHEAVAAERERAAVRRANRRARLVGGAVAAAVAALVALLTVVLWPAGGAPSVLEAAGLAGRGAAATAPPPDPARPGALDLAVDGVRFPAWGAETAWHASGQRSDTLSGRRTATVFYTGGGTTVAYTIVAGPPLPWPEGSRRVDREGVEVWVTRDGDRRIATWREGGRQCVISGPATVADDVLVDLAARTARAGPGYSAQG
ncbi:MAG: hypothetical protein AB7V42_14305 [Thermoleophilia bacterium]